THFGAQQVKRKAGLYWLIEGEDQIPFLDVLGQERSLAYGYAQAVHGSLPGQYRAAEVHARRIGNLVQIIMLLGPYCPFTLGSIMGYQQSRAQEGLRILGFRGMFMQESLAAHRLDDIVEHQ